MKQIREVDDAIRTIDAMLAEMERKRAVVGVKNGTWDSMDILSNAEGACFAVREEIVLADETHVALLEQAEQFLAAAALLLEGQKEDLTRLRAWLFDASLEMDRRDIAS